MRTFVSWVLGHARRSRVFPKSLLNRAADVDRMNAPIDAAVIVWFPTSLDSLYQLRGWYHALEELNRIQPVAIVCRDSRVSRQIRAESTLDAFSLSTSAQLDSILSQSTVKIALYVNLDPLDFDCLRFRKLMHIYIGHGDSDKQVFSSNQVKAFDRYFVAGEAAVERLETELKFYDAQLHAVPIGQPQLDGAGLKWDTPADPTGQIKVVYAPTWEGAHPSASYSSLISHGEAIIGSLLRAGHDVVYRPHPFTGHEDRAFAVADRQLRKIIDDAGQIVDTSPDLRLAFDGASALITDVSAVVSYWLPSGRALLVTAPASTDVAPDTLVARLPRLSVAEASHAADRIATLITDPLNYSNEVTAHLSDVTPGRATQTFVAAVGDATRQRDNAWNDGDKE